jgi:hypothetical protein
VNQDQCCRRTPLHSDLHSTRTNYLPVSRERLKDVPAAAGHLAACNRYHASLDITARPANTDWQHDLSVVRQEMANLEASGPKT